MVPRSIPAEFVSVAPRSRLPAQLCLRGRGGGPGLQRPGISRGTPYYNWGDESVSLGHWAACAEYWGARSTDAHRRAQRDQAGGKEIGSAAQDYGTHWEAHALRAEDHAGTDHQPPLGSGEGVVNSRPR